jgi:hypothetical protein
MKRERERDRDRDPTAYKLTIIRLTDLDRWHKESSRAAGHCREGWRKWKGKRELPGSQGTQTDQC